MRNVIFSDLKRAFTGPRIYIAVLILYIIWEGNSRRFSGYDDVLWLYVHTWGRATTSLLALVVTSFGFVSSYCEDLENQMLRYYVHRAGLKRYVISRVFVCLLTTFFIMACGTLLFLGIHAIYLPIVASDSVTVANFKAGNCFGFLLPERVLVFVAIQIILHAMNCSAMNVLALGLSTYVKNSFGVYVLPFVMNYCFEELMGRIAVNYPFVYMERIFDSSTFTYTMNATLFIVYAGLVSGMFVGIGTWILVKRVKQQVQ